MSASFRLDEQSKFSAIMLVKSTHIYWGLMAHLGILFLVSVNGDVSGVMSNKIALYLKHSAMYKVIVYTNTKSSA
jgi:hypothetical protein